MHPDDDRFAQIVQEIAKLHDYKAQDYGTGQDPYANVRASERWGVPAWVGAMMRLSDKVQRLMALAQRGYLVNEPPGESFKDIAVYAIIAQVLYEEATGAQMKVEEHHP